MQNIKSRAAVVGFVAAAVTLSACQPGEDEEPVPPGAVPAAPEMRPESDATPGGVAVPGAESDSAIGPGQPPTEQAPAGEDEGPG
ncbi:MAG: hypothetical protein WD737_11805 [Gemmatimonadota bacterium]